MAYPPPHQYPPYSPYPPLPGPHRPQRSVADLTISLIILAFTVVLGAGAAFFGLLSLAFLDNCPPETCSANGAVMAVLGSLIVAGATGIGGLVFTIVRLSRHLVAWPYALVTLGACTLILVFGGIGFVVAVDG